MAEVTLKAEKREEFKKSLSKQMRKAGNVPGIFYGHQAGNIPIVINELALRPVIFTSESHIINLEIAGESTPYSCIMKDVQFDPIKNRPIHFDLLALREGEKLNLDINVVIKGSAVGVKDGGILQQSLHKLQIECLPQNIPSHIAVDITNLLIGDSIRVGDIKLEGVTILNDESASIVTVVPPQAEEAPAEAAPAEETAEPEVIAKGKKEEEQE
jgi:large subunit ribosomal protein L25